MTLRYVCVRRRKPPSSHLRSSEDPAPSDCDCGIGGGDGGDIGANEVDISDVDGEDNGALGVLAEADADALVDNMALRLCE